MHRRHGHRGLVPFVVQEAEDFISQYKITGTLKEPKTEKRPLPTGILSVRKISGLLQNLSSLEILWLWPVPGTVTYFIFLQQDLNSANVF